ncbi:hypothetical protein Tco_0516754 [Tanacetum coccineum]
MRDIVRSKTERELVRVKIHDGNAFWNEIGVNAGVSKLMLLSLNLLLPALVYAARHSLTTVRHKLMLPGITSYYWKPEECDGLEGIIDFLNASFIIYALTVNPTIYTTCIKQFWATAKAKTVNEEVQIQALVDGKNDIITETSVIRALHLKDAEGTYSLPTATIFAELERMGEGKGFSGRDTPLFPTMMVQAQQEEGKGSAIPTDPHPIPFITQPSSSQPQQKQKPRRKLRKSTEIPSSSGEPIADEATNKEHIPTHSNDPLLSGEDIL